MFTLLGFLVMGYHPGIEDDGVYLSAVKADLDPALYPHDSDFFRLQLQATIFDRWMALFVRVTRIPVAWAELLWQFLSLYVILWSALRIAQKLFSERRSPPAGIALLAAMFTLPVAGTALNLADQHLHPRTMATALILLAIDRILLNKRAFAVFLLLLALLVHPIMAVFGISFCFFLALALNDRFYLSLGSHLSRILNSPAPLLPSCRLVGFSNLRPRPGAVHSKPAPTTSSTNGRGTSGWGRLPLSSFFGSSSVMPSSAATTCWPVSRSRFSSMARFNNWSR